MFGTRNRELVLLVMSDWPKAHEIVKQALQESNGNILEAARKLNVGKTTIYRWIDAHPELRSEIEELRNGKGTDELLKKKKREALRSAIIRTARELRNASANEWSPENHPARKAWIALDSALRMLDDHAVENL